MTDEIPFEQTFVATAETKRQLASAFVAERHRKWQLWLLYALVAVTLALLLLLGMDESFSIRVRLAWAVGVALAFTFVLAVLFATLAYVVTLRSARTRLFEGAVLESGFGSDDFVLRGELASSRISYRAVKSIKAHGDYVFLRQHGVPVVSVFPRALFPDEAIEGISRATRP